MCNKEGRRIRSGGLCRCSPRKGYVYHRALSNIMDCEEYDLPEALVLNNDNLTVEGRITYVPVYMVMFIVKSDPSVTQYRVDISELI